MEKETFQRTVAHVGQWISGQWNKISDWWSLNRWEIKWKIKHFFIILIGIVILLAIPVTCTVAIIHENKVAEEKEAIEARKPDYLGKLDSTLDITFRPVKLKGHEFWRYYSEGYHYIHSPECELCTGMNTPDTILVISNE